MPQKYTKPVYETRILWWAFDVIILGGILMTFEGYLYGQSLFSAAGPVVTIASAVAFLLLIYGSFIEPWRLTVKRYRVGKGERTLKIAYLSDIHVGPYKGDRWLQMVVARANALMPDLVLLGGDFIYDSAKDAAKLGPLASLRAPRGVYATLGNHDFEHGLDEVVAMLERLKIPLLRNRAVRFEDKNAAFAVAGVDDDWFGETDFDLAMREVLPGDRLILLIHNPELAKVAFQYHPSLMLSGHTHGGQIRLPLIGPLSKTPHRLGRMYSRGAFLYKEAPLIIGQGVGESGPRARLFCPPQIVLVTLRF